MLGSIKKGWEIAGEALEIAGGGGTYVLHQVNPKRSQAVRMQNEGWDVFGLNEWESLIHFARVFSRKKYENT
jgi:hypothetical protein